MENMLNQILIYKLDYVAFLLFSSTVMFLTNYLLTRKFKLPGLPKVMWLGFILLLVFAWVLAQGAENTVRKNRKILLENFAPTYAQEISKLGHEKITLDTPPDDPLYLSLIEAEIRWLKVNPGVQDIYTFRKKPDGAVVLIVDSETDYNCNGKYDEDREQRTEIGEVYNEVSEAVETAFLGNNVFDKVPNTDRWGTWISAYAPIYDTKGKIDGVLGVDYDAHEWINSIFSARIISFLFIFILLIIFLGITVSLLNYRSQVDEQSRIQKAFEAIQKRFNRAVLGSGEGLWEWKIGTDEVWYSKRYKQLLGYSEEEFQNNFKSFESILHPDDKQMVLDSMQKHIHQNVQFNVECRLKCKNGTYCWFHNRGDSSRVEEGKIVYMSGSLRDISHRKQIEEDLRKEKELALELSFKAQSAVKAKSVFLANMSHEIRTPMNAIIGFSNLLTNTKIDEEQKKYLDTIITSGDILLTIINDILDFSKFESDKVVLEDIDFNLQDLLTEIIKISETRLNEKNIQGYIDIEQGIPHWLKGDPTRLKQVLINLVSNAIKFTSKGQIGVIVKLERVESDNIYSKQLRISVKDTGIGISKEKQENLFQVFSQADSTITRNYGGTGLGLAICKRIVESMGGKIWVEAQESKGSEFIFNIPLREGTDRKSLSPSKFDEKAKTFESNKSVKKFVLVVDDVLVNQQLMEAYLNVLGCTCDFANNGQEAVDILRRNNKYDLCLMDLQMPVMGGEEATIIIRNEISKDLPIIALTAAAFEEDGTRCLKAGMNDYLTKPIDMVKLKEKVMKFQN